MTALILSVATGTWIAIVFKFINRGKVRAHMVICVNYVIAAALTALSCINSLKQAGGFGGGSWGVAVVSGVLLGLAMRANLIYTEKSTAVNGVGSTTFFNRIGFFPCILVTAVLWREIPGAAQCVGLALVIVSMLEMVRSFGRISVSRISGILLLMGSTTALELMNRIFSRYCDQEQKPFFLLLSFLTALAVSAVVICKKGRMGRITRKELLLGAALGIPNTLNNSLKLKSLETLSATTVFATFAVGTMVLSTVIGALLFKEKINRRTLFATALAAVSVALVNL